MNIKPTQKLIVLAVAATFSPGANALEYILDAGARVEYSNNIRLVETGEDDGFVGVLTSGISMEEKGPRLTSTLKSGVEYEHFFSDQFEDRANFGLNGNALWAISPDRLTWTVDDFFGQVIRDPTAARAPNNRQDFNVFSTGPDLLLRLNPVNTIDLGARYSNYYFEEQKNSNSVRKSGIVRWLYRYTPRTTLSLNYTAEETKFKITRDEVTGNFLTEDFERRDAYFGLDSRLTQTGSGYSLELGGTTIDRERSESVQAERIRLSLNRQSTPKRSMQLTASRELTDSARNLQGNALTGVDPALVSRPGQTEILMVNQVTAAVRSGFGFSTVGMTAYYRTEETQRDSKAPLPVFSASNSDLDVVGGGLEYGYQFTASLTGTANINASRTVYQDVDRIDRLASAGLGLEYRIKQPLTVNFNITQSRRRSEGALRGEEYDEFRAVLGVAYQYRTPNSRSLE